ncbi:hypothetical protein [Roseomonas sp. CECT 9278]|uniref:hypothetical protein n=1 Tax=Roseomonas sp. CECT 9278 TaxID=2845823 RepID=UPI001E553C16|nr:hypothetical protein [Roseomonas sp. CECT 9278]CAH0131255.1 hypothetical protein ROS9278_00244 [Roseomonas sp. CECT 9278]
MSWREPGAAATLCWFAAGGFLVIFAVTAGIERWDARQLGGVGVWAKPLKFQIATVVHLATMAWVASRLGPAWREGWLLHLLVVLAIASAAFEVGYITLQGALQQPSHFNVATPFHATMYSLMAVGAVVLTVSAGALGVVVALDGQARIGPGLRNAVALGLVGGTVLTLIIAFEMGGRMTHHVGTPPQPASRWPIFGWSRDVGDLRPPHFFATHMMQAVPALGWLADRTLPPVAAVVAAWIAAALWAALTWWLFTQALAGRPFAG